MSVASVANAGPAASAAALNINASLFILSSVAHGQHRLLANVDP
jgi:hypothetical protein